MFRSSDEVLQQTGTDDRWSDPRGEWVSAVAAAPDFTLLGATPLGTTEMPAAGVPILNTLGYIMHEGGHGPAASDWPVFVQFAHKHLVDGRD